MTKNGFEHTVLELLKELDRKYWDLCKDVAEVQARQAEHYLEMRHVKIDAEGALNGVRIINRQLDQTKEDTPVEVNVTADTESLTAYVHRLETLINDIEAKFAAWVETLEEDADIERKRIDALERAAVSETENDRPQRDTRWHPYTSIEQDGVPGGIKYRLVVLTKCGQVEGPSTAETWNWDASGDATIVAWRYAKGGE